MRIGIDLGGTKTELVVLDEFGAVRMRDRRPTPGGDYLATVTQIAAMVRDAEIAVNVRCSVGVGTPGSISPRDGLMRNANSTCLNRRALKQDLESALAREVRLANDANCFTLSEAVDGAGSGAQVVFGVILGTGVGGGIAIAGRVLAGANGVAGEWGHNPLPGAGNGDGQAQPCYCGRTGCIETWLFGPALTADHVRHGGAHMSAADIAEAAMAGNTDCVASLQRYEERLARALAGVINLLDPDVIVLGGGLSRLERLYRTVPELWRPHVFSDSIVTRLLPPVHGDASGVRGAAWLW
ncbi:ROK family protein [Methyloversatilis thermotolerans]|uniref:ROK family protein n=1 Tax=Methyloversatilis thermotolerans TaxID=1346290 RepID=UPI000365E0B7|nr:ROK family protein [Methyloversatilis thermotolerans]